MPCLIVTLWHVRWILLRGFLLFFFLREMEDELICRRGQVGVALGGVVGGGIAVLRNVRQKKKCYKKKTLITF